MSEIVLLPRPRQLQRQAGQLTIAPDRLILLDGPDAAALRFTAARLQATLQSAAGVSWAVAGGTGVPLERAGATLSVASGATNHAQGYQLTVTPAGIHAVASTPAGLFYAVATLCQLLTQFGATLPALRINDWPDFANRGVMLDVSRNRVLTLKTAKMVIDRLAGWKINQIQLYTEHTFAYQRHPVVWAEASPYTAADILELDAFCRERYIELVPNQNSFGHMHNWLNHDEYRHLAEAPDGAMTPWGFFRKGPFGLAVTEPGSLKLIQELYDELLPNFSSRQVNIGGDETYDLGQGKSKALVEEKGVGRVYLDYLLSLYREVKARGHTMQFWGDIIVKYPELVAELPRDAIALEWGYEADHPFDENSAVFAQSGIPFYVCPGTATWNSIAGRTDNAMENLRNAAANGLKHGAIGLLNTDWGDRGHWQPLTASYLGFAYGAALSWAYAANEAIELPAALDRFAFADEAGVMGQLAYDLGNAYAKTGVSIHNTSLLFAGCQLDPANLAKLPDSFKGGELNVAKLREAIAYVEETISRLPETRLETADAELVRPRVRLGGGHGPAWWHALALAAG